MLVLWGEWEMLDFPLVLMTGLNKTKSAVFLYCRFSLFCWILINWISLLGTKVLILIHRFSLEVFKIWPTINSSSNIHQIVKKHLWRRTIFRSGCTHISFTPPSNRMWQRCSNAYLSTRMSLFKSFKFLKPLGGGKGPNKFNNVVILHIKSKEIMSRKSEHTLIKTCKRYLRYRS